MTNRAADRRRWMCGIACVAVAGLAGSAQTALRVKGTVMAARGEGMPASIELEALHGYRGLEFVGQKSFTARANDKGQWSVLGVTSGVWMFTAHAPGRLPQVMLLPVQFTQKNPASAAGGQIPWEVAFDLAPAVAGSALERAARNALSGDRNAVAADLAQVSETGDAAALVAAGEIALYVRGSGLARALFDRALTLDPSAGRAQLGLASAAMMDGAWDAAAKSVWNAREQGVYERMRRALGGAITELQRIGVPDGTYRCPPGTPGC